ncbi:MAG: adenosylcobinamide-phosphate synthase CbiB [Lachnospiraceae bacterium]|nr:adenosylcobinamide-phosphate synthase CbiB [Lachnospiraceae bacterium]
MSCHMIAFFMGFLLDLVLGDPYCFPHPIRLIGKLITETETILRGIGIKGKEKKTNHNGKELLLGLGLVFLVSVSVVAVTSFLLFMSYRVHPILGVVVECIMTYQILAVKCLKVESMKVYRCLKDGNLEQARESVSMIVGRDTEALDEEGVAKAAIETVAENTSDGVIAPMLYLALGGPVLGFLYKAVNTMDSMVGYKNEKYLYFGKAAAKLDDFVNFLPARISAGLMIAASFLAGGDFSGKSAWQIYKRDRRNHASPNSGQTEAVCAGALSIRLAGDASYFGKTVKKPYIGDAVREVEYEDIKRANRLMYMTAWICEGLCLLVMYALRS